MPHPWWVVLLVLTAALSCERQPAEMICPDQPAVMCPWVPDPPSTSKGLAD